MADLNREALEVWNSLKPMIDKEITDKTQGAVQRRKAKVTTAPSLVTNTIGVTEAFGQEIFLPFVTNIASAVVGDLVWIEWMYGASNAFVSSFAEVDKKDFTVAGTLDVIQRRCRGSLQAPSASGQWYRIISVSSGSLASAAVPWAVDITIAREYNHAYQSEIHKITLLATYNKFSFMDEESQSGTLGIDKIRCVVDGSTCYVDIHYTTTYQNYANATFTVHTSPSMQGVFESVDFTSTVDSPVSPATVVSEYTFTAYAPMGEVTSLVTWDTTYVYSGYNMHVYRDGNKLIFSGYLIFQNGVNLQGAVIGTLDSSIACTSNSPIPCQYSPNEASYVNKALDVYILNSTSIRCANNTNNTTANLGGAPASGNVAKFSGVVPLA